MTENKRFLIDDAGELIDFDNHKFIDYGDECCKLLNELHEENQLLHKINEDAIDFMYDNFDSNIIFPDRELNDICNEMGWELSEKGIKIKQLEKENKQLRKENDMFSCELSVSANKEISRNCRIAELEEENKQLKQNNTELINKIDFLERVIDGDVE